MDPIDRQIGARLRALREQRGLTVSELADSIGAASSDLDQYETGSSAAPASLVVKLARVLQVAASDLIGDDQSNWTAAVEDLARAAPDGAVDLVSAFSGISDHSVRRAFLDLAWTIVDAQSQSDPGRQPASGAPR